ncbi:MAG TPA: efflux RND transporter periplasmic adaptor subunit [Gemmataceae bacterium]|jgi:multidrug resistance efflux pump|nr:efflux RND transporter periplasmic adaptor subunit [Gemmataceae bacterium]
MSERNENNAVTSPVAVEAIRKPEPTSLSERVRSLRLPEQQVKKSSRGIIWVLGSLCLLLALSTAGFGYLYFNQPKVDDARASDVNSSSFDRRQSEGAHATEIGTVVHESKGNVVPVHQIQVSPKVSGLILKLRVKKDEKDEGVPLEEGMRVEKNWILAELEDIDYKADYNRAEAALEEARQNLLELTQYRQKEIDQTKARWSEAEVQRKQLEIDRRRSSKLKNTNALADREFEQADSAYLAMLAREQSLRVDYEFMIRGPRDNKIEAANRRVKQAEEEVVKNRWRLDNCTIRAPISGTILTKFAEEGNIVNQLSLNLKGSICDMADLSDLEIDLSIQERDVSRVFKGQRCRIRPEAYPDRTYDGYVSRLMPIADRGKGAVPVRVKLIVPKDEEQGAYLKPEMGAVVSFLKKEEGKEAKK